MEDEKPLPTMTFDVLVPPWRFERPKIPSSCYRKLLAISTDIHFDYGWIGMHSTVKNNEILQLKHFSWANSQPLLLETPNNPKHCRLSRKYWKNYHEWPNSRDAFLMPNRVDPSWRGSLFNRSLQPSSSAGFCRPSRWTWQFSQASNSKLAITLPIILSEKRGGKTAGTREGCGRRWTQFLYRKNNLLFFAAVGVFWRFLYRNAAEVPFFASSAHRLKSFIT